MTAARKKTPKKKAWFGDDGACVELGDAIRKRNAWGDETDALYQEYVAREHVDGGMPVVELQRSHGIALSAVKRWIATYLERGRKGLELAAANAREATRKRDEKLAKAKVDPDEILALTDMISSRDLQKKRAAYTVIQKRKLRALIPAIVGAIAWANTKKDVSIQDELDLLAALKAKEALHELLGSKMKIMVGYEGWFTSLLKKAGCAIRTVEMPWSQHYEIEGTWYPVKVRS
jgi:hypothetical protein